MRQPEESLKCAQLGPIRSDGERRSHALDALRDEEAADNIHAQSPTALVTDPG